MRVTERDLIIRSISLTNDLKYLFDKRPELERDILISQLVNQAVEWNEIFNKFLQGGSQ